MKKNEKLNFLIGLLLILLLSSEILLSGETRYSLVKINYQGDLEEFFRTNHLEFGEEDILSIDKNSFQAICNKAELSLLTRKKLNYEIVIPDLESHLEKKLINSTESLINLDETSDFKLGSMSGYFTLNEIYDFFDNLSTNHLDLIAEKFEIGNSVENRPIYCYVVGNKVIKDNPKLLITALHHSREPLCLMTLAYFINDILNNYEKNDEKARSILDNNLIYIVPVVNPDGYIYNQVRYPNGGGLWRKNRRMHNDTTFGVDINRNYGPYEYWNAQNFGSSTDSTIETYRGKEPFSEPETQAIKRLCESNNFKMALNLHSYGNLLLYPNSALSKETVDSNLFRGIARHINSKNLFCFGRDLQTVGYSSRGTSDDWMYLENDQKPKIMAFTAEIGTPADFFWPESNKIISYCQNSLNLYYEFLNNSYSNLVPINYEGYFDFKDNKFNIDFEFQNIGLKQVENECIITFEPLNKDIEVINPIRYSQNLKPSEIQKENFKIQRNKQIDAKLEMFRLTIQNEKYLYEDTLSFFIDKYDSINLFDKGKLKDEWILGSWGLEFVNELNEFVLSDSPKGFYKNNNENYLQQMTPIKLITKDAILEFKTMWSTEANRDACVLQISTDEGKSWSYLKTQRMIVGDGAQKSKFIKGLYGLHGTFNYWNVQSVNLEDFYGQEVLFRFGLLSDQSKNFDGWYLKNIKLKLFQNTSSTESISNDRKILIYPNPLTSNDKYLKIELKQGSDFIYKIFDCIGKEYFLPEVSKNEKIISLDPGILKTGIYFIVFQSKNDVNVLKIIVLE